MAALLSVQVAAATPRPATMALLRGVERDLGAAIAQIEVLNGRLDAAAGAEGPGAGLVGIADGSYRSALHALLRGTQRLERGLTALWPSLRRSDDRGAGEVLLAMRVELSTMSLARSELTAEGEDRRAAALERLRSSLHMLDGAVAAAWSLVPPADWHPGAAAAGPGAASASHGHLAAQDAVDDDG
jgi:hypothetical protein